MVSFKVVYRCNTCSKNLAIMGNLDQLDRVEIPIDGISCNDCGTDNRCIVLVGPDQPEYRLGVSGTITLLGCTLSGPKMSKNRVTLSKEEV